MSFQKQTCVLLSCDGCGNNAEFDYVPHFDSEDEANEYAKSMDWFVRGEIHLGDECLPIPEEECDDCGDFAEDICAKHLTEHVAHLKASSASSTGGAA